MRRIILGLGISLDGYIARPDGSVDFLFMPKDYSMGPFFKTIDTTLMGRKTYEVGLKMSGGKIDTYGFATYVFSRTLPPGERDGITFTAESPRNIVETIRKKPGKHIWLMGGGELAREFLQHDLVDELYLGIVPTLIGTGLPLFPSGFPERKFTLLKNETFSRGLVVLTYQRALTNSKSKSRK